MCCEKFAANALYNIKCFTLSKKRFPRRLTNESFFSKLVFLTLSTFFSKTHEVLPPGIVDFVETSCFIDCL